MSDDEGILLSDLLADFTERLAVPLERYPNIRRGEREPIPGVVRVSIYRRDGWTCRHCGQHDPDGNGLELDHMLPWSAGGSDDSSNLRTLCSRCNQERSNWNDGDDHHNVRPTTWWCWECWRAPGLGARDNYESGEAAPRRRRPLWRNGTNLNAAPHVTGTTEQVYCAWCWGYGYSNVWFSPTQQDELARMTLPWRGARDERAWPGRMKRAGHMTWQEVL